MPETKTNEPPQPRRTAVEPQDPFRQVRAAHRSETAEDYVELIADLIEENGEARMTDIAARLGVSVPTGVGVGVRVGVGVGVGDTRLRFRSSRR